MTPVKNLSGQFADIESLKICMAVVVVPVLLSLA